MKGDTMLEEAKKKLEELVENYNGTNQAIVDAQAKQAELRLAIAEQQGFIKGLESDSKKDKKEK
jgi:prefoldin subunit 5